MRNIMLGGLVLAMACTSRDVVAKVGSRQVKVAEVQAVVAARSKASAIEPAQALEALIDRELFAEAARGAGLAEDPALQARLRGLEREVLAQAFLDREAKSLDEAALKKRYAEQAPQLTTRQVHVAQPSSRLKAAR